MQIIPVIDLLNGVVVRGVAGRRETYRPIESRICSSADPLAIAAAFRDHFGLCEFYIADLDAILYRRPNLETYRQLAASGCSLWIDAGIEDLDGASEILDSGANSLVIGLESWPQPELLRSLVTHFGKEKILFSLDLQQGRPLINHATWAGLSPLEIAQTVFNLGVNRLIVLDLAQVGIGSGISTLELCATLRAQNPQIELITGGGVRDRGDLQLLASRQLDGVLIASALHNGRLCRSDLESCSS